jgi:hypothetical protein
MSDKPITLDLLGNIVRDMQAEQRRMHTRLDTIETRFSVIEARLSGLETRFASLEHGMHLGFEELEASNRRIEGLLTSLVASTRGA